MKREEAVAQEMNKRLSDDKKMSKKEKDERYLTNFREYMHEAKISGSWWRLINAQI